MEDGRNKEGVARSKVERKVKGSKEGALINFLPIQTSPVRFLNVVKGQGLQ